MYDPNNFDELEDFWMKSRKLTEENFVGAWWINFIPISILSLGGFPWNRALKFLLELDNVKFTWFFKKTCPDFRNCNFPCTRHISNWWICNRIKAWFSFHQIHFHMILKNFLSGDFGSNMKLVLFNPIFIFLYLVGILDTMIQVGLVAIGSEWLK